MSRQVDHRIESIPMALSQLWSLVCALVTSGILIMAAGCGGPAPPTIAPVSGIVRYGGVPVRDAYVKFSQDGCPIVAGGFTDDSGRFELTSYEQGDGAPVGENEVTITATPRPSAEKDDFQAQQAEAEALQDPAERRRKLSELSDRRKQGGIARKLAEPRSRIPQKYSSPETSKLKFTVEAGTNNECDFDLTD
jgi:hypothetical protein